MVTIENCHQTTWRITSFEIPPNGVAIFSQSQLILFSFKAYVYLWLLSIWFSNLIFVLYEILVTYFNGSKYLIKLWLRNSNNFIISWNSNCNIGKTQIVAFRFCKTILLDDRMTLDIYINLIFYNISKKSRQNTWGYIY